MAMQVSSEVFREGKSHYNGTQNRTERSWNLTHEEISAGLAQRLARYALNRLDDAGFKSAVEGWECIVTTFDGSDKPADREYHVRWKNPKGGFLDVDRIFTRNGWPFLDHGISAGQE
jgi:hypothetical protein